MNGSLGTHSYLAIVIPLGLGDDAKEETLISLRDTNLFSLDLY